MTYRTGGAESAPRPFSLALAEKSIARFPSPLIEPDVQLSRIRLSDGIHLTAYAGTT